MKDQYPVPHAQVAARVVEGQAVIVLADSGQVNIFNAVGTRIWELVDGAHSIQQIAHAITNEFQVAPEVALRDVEEFLRDLETNQVVELRVAPESGAAMRQAGGS